jgi:DNA-directed RNA polymerase II subunit RPB11
MNQPDRYARFVLPEDVKKLEWAPDQKLPSAGTYILEREDHTLGNLVRMQLLRNPNVVFAGYRIPHPLEPRMVVRLQTTDATGPQDAFVQALHDLRYEVAELQAKLSDAFAAAEEATACAEAEAAAAAGADNLGGGGGVY